MRASNRWPIMRQFSSIRLHVSLLPWRTEMKSLQATVDSPSRVSFESILHSTFPPVPKSFEFDQVSRLQLKSEGSLKGTPIGSNLLPTWSVAASAGGIPHQRFAGWTDHHRNAVRQRRNRQDRGGTPQARAEQRPPYRSCAACRCRRFEYRCGARRLAGSREGLRLRERSSKLAAGVRFAAYSRGGAERRSSNLMARGFRRMLKALSDTLSTECVQPRGCKTSMAY